MKKLIMFMLFSIGLILSGCGMDLGSTDVSINAMTTDDEELKCSITVELNNKYSGTTKYSFSPEEDVLEETFIAPASCEGYEFKEWIGDCDTSRDPRMCDVSIDFTYVELQADYKAIALYYGNTNDAMTAYEHNNSPRVMFWSGKVNQHWDLNEQVWKTDPDGSSGANVNKLDYCKKFYPGTISVMEYKEETTNTWRNGGNTGGPFTSTKMSYLCVLESKDVFGCTDSEALNYNSAATQDDGSCKYKTEVKFCAGGAGIVLPFDEDLCWQKDVSDTPMNFDESLSYCNSLNLGGIESWDLPTVEDAIELTNYLCEKYDINCPYCKLEDGRVVDCGGISGANLGTILNNNEGFSGVIDFWYWTKNETSWSSPSRTVYVTPGLGAGGVGANDPIYSLYVMCVSRPSVVPVDVFGCTDSKALNYNSAATQDDGSCKYAVFGCTDSKALNYNSAATQDDGSCNYAPEVKFCPDGVGIILPFDEDLCWQKDVSAKNRNHADTLSYCSDLNLGGAKWDVPTRTEMVELRNYACEKYDKDCAPCDAHWPVSCRGVQMMRLGIELNNNEGFSGFDDYGYWTKTMATTSDAWSVGLFHGYVQHYDGYPLPLSGRVVCVSRK